MMKRSGLAVVLAGILVLSVFIAGCSDSGQSAGNQTTVPTTTSGAKFTTGDIIAKTATSTDTVLLVVKYDAAADKYERAFVYKKPDGSYYRKDEKTELSTRSMIEKLYPAKVSHVSSLSQVPIVTPTAATTAPTATVTTTATTSYPAPTVSSITPNAGLAGTTVTITSISGTNFRSGATVRLVNGTTSLTISGSSVAAQSASNITCLFSIPSSATAGTWNVTVTNPDGQVGTLANAFTITNTTTTTTTTTTAPPAPMVSSVTPSSAMTGIQVNITNLAGSNLLNITSVKLTRSGSADISASNVTVISSTQVTCSINLAGATPGEWNVMATNSGGQSGIGTNLFTVNPEPMIVTFSGTPTSGAAPLTVSFTGQSTGSPTTWTWNFGEGNTSSLQNPTNTFIPGGPYSITLTVSNAGGSNSTTLSNYITII